MPKRALMMHPHDNVATAVEDIQVGEDVAIPVVGTTLILRTVEAIPFGFKVAVQGIPKGEIIRKYGETIGTANTTLSKGALVHVHNLDGTRARGDLAKRGAA